QDRGGPLSRGNPEAIRPMTGIPQDRTDQQSAAGEPGSPRLLIILAVLLGFASISTDLFLPALPAMQLALGASEGTLQFAISAYLLGFGFGQLFWGPVSD